MPRYTYNGKTYNVPDNQVAGFLSRKPSAKPLEENTPVMTSVGIGTPLTKSERSTPRESNIPKPTGTTADKNQPAEAYAPQSSGFAPMVAPAVPKIDTKLASPAELFAPKSNEQVVGDAFRTDFARHMADPAVRFENALNVYRDSGEYERDKAKKTGEQKLPPIAQSWLDSNKVDTSKGYQGVLTKKLATKNTPEQIDLVNRFIANSQEGRDYAAEYAEQVKWLDGQIAGLEAKIEDAKQNAPRTTRSQYIQTSSGQYGASGYFKDIEVPENERDIQAADTQLTELKMLRQAVEDGDRSAFGQFFGELGRRAGTGVMNIATLGVSDPMIKAGVNRALQDEDNVLTKEAADLLGQWQTIHANDRSIAQDIAQGVPNSLAFMAQFAVTGGAASAITKGAATAIAGNLGGKLAAQAVGKMGEMVGGAFVRTALSPSTLAGAYELNAQNPGSFLDAYSQMFTQNLIEYASEGMGAAMPGGKIFGGAKTRFGRALGRVGEHTGVQGVGTEYLEEQFATLGHSIAGDGQASWADFVDPRTQLVTAGSVAFMQLPNVVISAGGYGAGKAKNAIQTRSIRKGYDMNLNHMNSVFSENAAEIVGVVNEQLEAEPDVAIHSLVDTLSEEAELSDRQKDAVMKYALSRSAMYGLERAKTEEVEAAAQSVVPLVDQNVNPQTGSIMTATIAGMDSPAQIFGDIKLHDDGTIDRERSAKQVYYNDAEGNRQVTSIDFVGEIVENIPAVEAAAQITEMATAPIIARQQNDEVRPYEVGERVRFTVNGQPVTGEISGIDDAGNYIVDAGMAQMPVEPRQIVNEDNIRGVENGSEILYMDESGNQVEGVAVVDPILYEQGLIGLEDGDPIPIANVVGLAAKWRQPQAATNTSAETSPQSSPATGKVVPTEQAGAQATAEQSGTQAPDINIETIVANAPKQKDGTVDYDALMETDPEAFAALYESEEGAEETRAELQTVSDNIGKNIASAQKALDGADSINKRKAARAKITQLMGKKAQIDGIIGQRYTAPTAEPASATAATEITTPSGTVVEEVQMPTNATVESPLEPSLPPTARPARPRKLTPRQKFVANTVPANVYEATLLRMMGDGKLSIDDFVGRTGYERRDMGAANRLLTKDGVPFDTFESDFYATYHPSEYEAGFESNLDEITQAVNDYIEDRGATDALVSRFRQADTWVDPDGEARAEYAAQQVADTLELEDEIFSTDGEQSIEELLTFARELGISEAVIDATTTNTDVISLIQDYQNGTGTTDIHPGSGSASEGGDSVSRGQGEVNAQETGGSGERDGRGQTRGAGVQDSGSQRDDAGGLRADNLTEEEQRIVNDATAQFKPITAAEFDRLIERLKRSGLAGRVVTDPAQFREVLIELLGEEDAAMFLSVWHGSPANFKKFSTAFIGSGEGAWAFGYGLYFTSRQDIAGWYANKLKPAKYRENAKINSLARQALDDAEGNVERALQGQREIFAESWSDKKRVRGIIKVLETGKPLNEGKSTVYEVDINDNLNFVDWYNPLTEEQIAAIRTQAREDNITDRWGHRINDEGYYPDSVPFSVGMTAQEAYNQLDKEFFNDNPAELSAFLNRAGIDGVRYPAESTTSKTDASSENYVVFDDSAVQIKSKIRMMATTKGDVYGFVVGDTVYLDSTRMNANTPIHEFGHLWNSMIRESNPELWERGSALIRQSEYWTRVNDNPAYRNLSDDRKVDEALAMAIGNKGEDAFNNQDVVAYAGVKGWIWQAWEWIKSKLGIARGTNIEDMTLSDFTDLAVRQLLGGRDLRSSKENSTFANENDSENGTGTETRMDNRRAMVGGALRGLVGGQSQAQGISRTVEAANLGGIDRTVRSTEELDELESRGINPNFSKPNFRKALTEAAKENGAWLDASYLDGKELRHDQRARGTSENDVYKNPDGKTLTKLNNLSYVTGSEFNRNMGAVIDRLAAHNALFPEVAYEIKGFMTNKNGFPALVLEQMEVDAERNATQEEIDQYLQSHGFALSGTRNWSNHHPVWSNGTYELFDARPANVLMGRDGNLYFIDTIPHSAAYMSGVQPSEVISRQEVSEMEQIRKRAVDDGTFMKAPNGQPTNLTERQWLQVRTANFKNWFGDWEKAARIDKLRNSTPVEITGQEITPSEDLKEYRKNAKEYGLNLRGEYTNSDTGVVIAVNRGSINEVVSHAPIAEQIKSVAAIPQLIENAIYIDSQENTDKAKRPDIALYDYYVAGLKIDGVDYTARLSIARSSNGELYYDHSLTEIEKGSLIHQVDLITNQGRESGSSSTDAGNSPLSEVKDTKLVSILQINSSKVVDENGEPRVVYHGGVEDITEFYARGFASRGMNFFTSDRSLAEKHARHGQVNGLYEVFLDMKAPLIIDAYGKTYNQWYDDTAGWETVGGQYAEAIVYNLKDSPSGSDRRVRSSTIYAIGNFNNSQIKSATDNTGEFSAENNDIRFQSVSDVARATGSTMTEEVRNELDGQLKSFAFRLREAWEDRHLAVKKFFDTLRENGVKIEEYNDFYMQATHVAGKNDAQLRRYGKQFQEKINKAIADLEAADFTYRDIENYVILKHGMERNEWMRSDAIRKYKEENPEASLTQLREFERGLPRDYSGMTAVEAEIGITAGIFVSDFERRAGEELVNNLWSGINGATKFSLKKLLDGGMISRQVYDDLVARYQFYIPLRGHDAETAADRWDYTANTGTYFVAPLIRAKGRTSRSESPFAYIFSMAQSAISSANKNTLNQTILRLAMKDKTGLMSASKAWYVNAGYNAAGKPQYEVQSPEYSENPEQYRQNIEEFEARMSVLAEQGQAFKGRKKLNIGGAFIKPSQAAEHEVHVFQNGEEYVVYINANPAVARAINGANVRDLHKDLRFLANVSRQMSANFTTRNPLFILSNFARDYIFSSSILAVKEDLGYALQFQRNLLGSADALQRYVRGGMNLSKESDIYLNEYILNGGKTGFSHILELQTVQRQIERDIRSHGRKNAADYTIRPLLSGLEAMNDMAENMSRLSVYITSRKQGRSVTQSISDAKEVTVNFNRSGAGGMGSEWVRPLYLFVNAGIQALANFTKAAVKNPGKATALMASYAASGFFMPFLAGLMGGDDGREEYMKLGDWERQNNLCIYTGSGFIKIPLPHELRVFHRMGDNVFMAWFGGKDVTEMLIDVALGFADLLPANPTGAVDGSWADMMPDALKPFFQLATNRNFTGSRIRNEWADPNKPGYLKIRTNKKGEPYAPAFFVKLAEGLDAATGGDGVEKGLISINPDAWNHLIRGYFGGLYTMTAQGLDVASKTIDLAKTGEFKLKVRETPLRTFFTSSDDLQISGSGLNSRYFKMSDQTKETLRQVKGYKEQVANGTLGIEGFTEKIKGLDVARANEANAVIKQIGKYERSLKELDSEEQREVERIIAQLKETVIEIYKK